MKKTLLLPLALSLAGAANLHAVDVYITGSTAFRATVYNACQNLFSTPPTVRYGANITGGGNGGQNNSDTAWAMTGNAISSITQLGGGSLTIHALFTGSVQGIQAVENNQLLQFPNADGTGPVCNTYTNAAATLAFSDVYSVSTGIYDVKAASNVKEEEVAVQPFVMCRSKSTSALMNSVNNVNWDQMRMGIPNGRIPLSAWSGNAADTNTFVYLLERTKDSGTRRTLTAEHQFQFNEPLNVYIYDTNSMSFFAPTIHSNTPAGTAPYGVVDSTGGGLNGANLNWDFGYVGGGDIRTALNYTDPQNLSIGILSFADAQKANLNSQNWGSVVSYGGLWPTAAGSALHGNTATNDFSPVTSGFYPLWATEVVVHLVDPTGLPGQNINAGQLGDWKQAGTFMGVFNAQTINTPGSPMIGSIEREIELTKTNLPGATAIRLSDMVNAYNRPVGGTIAPPTN
jgi:hypothetical protein